MATAKKNAPKSETVEETVAMTAPETNTALVEVDDYGDDAGKGYENQDNADRKMPILMLVQSGSQLVKDDKAADGQWFNTVTGKAYDSIEIIPAITDHVMLEWVSLDDGGGFRGRHKLTDQIVVDAIKRNGGTMRGKLPVPSSGNDEKGKPLPPTELVETFEIVGLQTQGYINGEKQFPDDYIGTPVMLSFKSTAIKEYRALQTNLGHFKAQIRKPDGTMEVKDVPLFAHRVLVSSKDETKKGKEYKVPDMGPAVGRDIVKSLIKKTDPRYVLARQMNEQFLKGEIAANYEKSEQDDGEPAGATDAAGDAKKAPF